MAVPLFVFVLIKLVISQDTINHHPNPLSITSSGAVSLGSYQAGYHYYAIEWLKINKQLFDVKTVTGASAGAINALFTVLSLADTTCFTDTQSIFYKAWIPIGIDQLKGSKDARGLFNRSVMDSVSDAIIQNALKRLEEKTDASTLDLVLAVTVNRNQPINEKLKRLTIPRSKDFFVIKVDKKANQPVTFKNYFYDDLNRLWNILPLGDSINRDKGILKGIVYSSSAFPGAFAPYDQLPVQEINTHVIKTNQKQIDLSSDTLNIWKYAEKSHPNQPTKCPSFSDGGIFSNEPIRLAYQLSMHGLMGSDSAYRWKKNLTTNIDTQFQNDSSMIYAYLNPRNVLYPTVGGNTDSASKNIFEMISKDFPNIFETARKNDLFTLVEESDRIEDKILLTENYVNQMSGYFGNFFGFFDKDFRKFDFYLGMYDADKFLNSKQTAQRFSKKTSTINHLNLTYALSDSKENIIQKWGRVLDDKKSFNKHTITQSHQNPNEAHTLTVRYEYSILKDILDQIFNKIDTMSVQSTEFHIQKPDNDSLITCCDPNMLILLQITIDRLWANWQVFVNNYHLNLNDNRDVIKNIDKWKRLLEIANNPPQLIPGIRDKQYQEYYKSTLKAVSEHHEADAVIDLLDKYMYRFEDKSIYTKGFKPGITFKAKIVDDITDITDGFIDNMSKNDAFSLITLGISVPRATKFMLYQPDFFSIEFLYNVVKGKSGSGLFPYFHIANLSALSLKFRCGIVRYGPFLMYNTNEVNGFVGVDASLLGNTKFFLFSNAVCQPSVSFSYMAGNLKKLSTENSPLSNIGSNQYGLCIAPSIKILELIKLGIDMQWIEHNKNIRFAFNDDFRFVYQVGINLTGRDFGQVGRLICYPFKR